MRLAGGARRASSRQPCARAFLFLLAAATCRRAAGIVGSTAMPLRTGDTGDLGPPVRREACRARAPSPLRLSAVRDTGARRPFAAAEAAACHLWRACPRAGWGAAGARALAASDAR